MEGRPCGPARRDARGSAAEGGTVDAEVLVNGNAMNVKIVRIPYTVHGSL